ncbi:MAG: hypothetical protein JW861_10340 [Bacteroidales bacterium]|nr:hypothetical protein [Bacteroidales bacterium]
MEIFAFKKAFADKRCTTGRENMAKSLKVYYKRFSPELAIRISMSDYRRHDSFVNIPLYAISRSDILL